MLDNYREDIAKQFNISPTEEEIRFSSMRRLLPDNSSVLVDFTKHNMYGFIFEGNIKSLKLNYIRDEFRSLTGKREVDAFISENIVGLVANESRYDNSVVSPAGAFGMMQLMPGKIRNAIVNPNEYSEEEVK